MKYLDPATNVQDDIDAPGAMRPRGIKAGNAALIQTGQQMDRHALLAMTRTRYAVMLATTWVEL